jgi:hypothetical protein
MLQWEPEREYKNTHLTHQDDTSPLRVISKTLFHISAIPDIYRTHLALLDLITVIVFDKGN